MKRNKALGVVLWLIGLAAAHLIVFVVPSRYTAALWVTYGFTLFAFLFQLALWLWIWRKELPAPEQFLYTPALTISAAYVLLQLAVALVFALVSAAVKAAVLVNALLAIVMSTALVLSLMAKNTIRRTDERQKDHHIKL